MSCIPSPVGYCRIPAWRSLGLNDLHGLVELERQHGFCGYLDRASLSQNLGHSTTSCAGAGSDRSTFPASRNRPDDGAEGSGATGIFGGALVRSESLLAALLQVRCAHHVLLPLDRNRLQVQHKVGSTTEASSLRRRSDHDLRIRTMRDDDIAVRVKYVVSDFGCIGLPFGSRCGVDRIIGPNRNLRVHWHNVSFGVNLGFRRMVAFVSRTGGPPR